MRAILSLLGEPQEEKTPSSPSGLGQPGIAAAILLPALR